MAYSEPDVEIKTLLRVAVIAVGCLIAGVSLLVRSYLYSRPTPLESLQKVTGTVKLETGIRGDEEYPVLVIDRERYKYLDWFPNADTLPTTLRSGETISIWTDAKTNRWVWQIERNGEQLVPYAAVHDAVAANKAWDPVLGVFVFVLGIVGSVRLAYLTKPFWQTTPHKKKKTAGMKSKKRTKSLES